MAKSYITKFVEYVKDCKNQLKNNLITKGQQASDTETLDSLISKVTNINLDTTIPDSSLDYVRDPNLPNVDAMFDTDPLRVVNGGEYPYCQYLVCLFPTKGSHGVKFAPFWSNTSYCSRIDFSDGTSYDSSNTTSSSNTQTFTIGDSGIYTLENGSEVFIVKIYADTSHALSVYQQNFLSYSYEVITDYESVVNPYYNGGSTYKYLKYLRLMNTNGTYVNISSGNIQSYMSDSYLVIDGDCTPFFNITYNMYFFPNIKINGTLYNTSSTIKIGINAANVATGFPIGNYLKIPDLAENSTVPSVEIGFQHLKGLYLPDWVKTITADSKATAPQFKKLHIGNGLVTPTYFTGARYFLNLTDLTLSPNAFSQNTNAVTLHFDYMVNLTTESIANLVTNLADRTGKTTNTIRLPITIGNRMTSEQITTLQNKNWTVTFV